MILALILATLTMGDQSMTDEPGAVLEIEAPRDEVKVGEPVLVQVTLANRGSQPLWLNERLGPNSPLMPPPFRELTLSIVGPDGRKLRFVAKVNRDPARPKDFCVLRPNEAVTATLDLANYYLFDQEGVYTVRARHADGSREVPPAPEGALLFRGPLLSNEVQVRIVP